MSFRIETADDQNPLQNRPPEPIAPSASWLERHYESVHTPRPTRASSVTPSGAFSGPDIGSHGDEQTKSDTWPSAHVVVALAEGWKA